MTMRYATSSMIDFDKVLTQLAAEAGVLCPFTAIFVIVVCIINAIAKRKSEKTSNTLKARVGIAQQFLGGLSALIVLLVVYVIAVALKILLGSYLLGAIISTGGVIFAYYLFVHVTSPRQTATQRAQMQDAKRCFDNAHSALRGGDYDTAKMWYQKICDAIPGTDDAAYAKQKLEEITAIESHTAPKDEQ